VVPQFYAHKIIICVSNDRDKLSVNIIVSFMSWLHSCDKHFILFVEKNGLNLLLEFSPVRTARSRVWTGPTESLYFFMCPDSQKPCPNRIYRKINSLHVSGQPEAVFGQTLQKVPFSSCVRTYGFPIWTEFTESLLSALYPGTIITCPDAAA